jgi:hypothetical protein
MVVGVILWHSTYEVGHLVCDYSNNTKGILWILRGSPHRLSPLGDVLVTPKS